MLNRDRTVEITRGIVSKIELSSLDKCNFFTYDPCGELYGRENYPDFIFSQAEDDEWYWYSYGFVARLANVKRMACFKYMDCTVIMTRGELLGERDG